MAFDQEIAAIDIGGHLVLVPDIHVHPLGHQRDDGAGDVERDIAARLPDTAVAEQVAGCQRARRHHHALAGANGALPAIAQRDFDGMRDAFSIGTLVPQYFGRFGPVQYPGRFAAGIAGGMGEEALRHGLFAAIGTAGVAIAAIDAFAVRRVRAVVLAEPCGDGFVVHGIVRPGGIFVPPVDQVGTIVAADNRVDLRDVERLLDGSIAAGKFRLAYWSPESCPGLINIFGIRMNQTLLFHAQADAIVDDSGSADHAPLKYDDVAVGGGLQRAILEQPRGHPGLFMGNPGRGIVAAGFDDQGFMSFIGDGCGGDGTAGPGTDHDHIGFLRHGIMTDEHLGGEIATGLAADRTLPGGRAIALCRQLESEIGIDGIVEIFRLIARLPVAVIASENDALGPGDVLKKIDPGILQTAADQVFADPGRGEEKKRSAQQEQQPVKRQANFVRLVAVDIGEMFLQIFDHLIGGYRHFAVVEQGLGHRLDHQRLQSIERFLHFFVSLGATRGFSAIPN